MRTLFVSLLVIIAAALFALLGCYLFRDAERPVRPVAKVAAEGTPVEFREQPEPKFFLTGRYAAHEESALSTTFDTLTISRRQDNALYRLQRVATLHLHAPSGTTTVQRYRSCYDASYEEETGILHLFPGGELAAVKEVHSRVLLGKLVYSKIE